MTEPEPNKSGTMPADVAGERRHQEDGAVLEIVVE